MTMQKRARTAGAQVEFNPFRYSAPELYVYAYEMGLTDQIRAALRKRAEEASQAMLLQFQRPAIVLDMTKSMEGSRSQRLRPAATA